MNKRFCSLKKILVNILIVVVLLSSFLVFPVSAASSWSKPRPSSDTTYDETIGNANEDGIASVDIGVTIGKYSENDPGYGYHDHLSLRISISANTREGIEYGVGSLSYNWYTVSDLTGITGDNAGVWLNLPFPVLYYGVEYAKVWVCSNGFLSFDWPSTSPTPESIPNPNKPNSTIAPFWRDLNPAAGGSITYGYVGSSPYGSLFVISWNNVPNQGNNVQQTFQVIICRALSGGYGWYHNRIIFQYQSITKDYATVVGIEDQVGKKGTSYDYNQLSNHSALVFIYDILGYRLEQLKIKLTKSNDGYARIDPLPSYIGGYNLALVNPADGKFGDVFLSVIEFAGSLAIGFAVPPSYVVTAGIIYGALLVIGHGAAAALSNGLSEPQFQWDWATENETEAYVTAPAQTEQYYLTGLNPFDSTLAATVEWSFLDPNTIPHDLTITAEAMYKDLSNGYYYTTPPASTTLNMYIPVNLPPLPPSTPSGPTSGTTYATYYYSTSTTDPNGDNVRYLFDWGDGATYLTGWLASGMTVMESHYWASTGTYNVKVRAQDTFYEWSDWSPSLSVSIPTSGRGGVGCPYVSTWNGTQYVLDNNLIPAAEHSNANDVTDYYMLQQMLAQRDGGTYSLLLSEFENEHDFFDRVQLIEVDHSNNVNVAISPYGEILTYTNPSPPMSAIDNNNQNVKSLLKSTDGNYYEGYNGSYITLNFGDELDVSQGAKLVIRSDIPMPKSPVDIQIINSQGEWHTVATIYTRTCWSTDIIDMSKYLPDARGNLKLRLHFVSNDKIDFVGLDTSPQATTQVQEGQLTSASHSTDGDVTVILLHSDQTYAELVPGQEIRLEFALPPQTMETRNYIIIIEGRYVTFT